MCTNRALVDSLECYMDDLVDSFEDFVKKSLILISVGVATVLVMFVYMLKVLTDRSGTPNAAVNTNDQNLRRYRSNTSIPSNSSRSSVKRNNIKSDYLLSYDPKLVSSSANTQTLSAISSFDERALKEIGYYTNCNRTCELKPRILKTSSPARYRQCFDSSGESSSGISIPSLPTCQKQHLPPSRNCVKVLKRASCCSICCDNDKSNI